MAVRYEDDFKIKMVELYNAGKPSKEIVAEYGMSKTILNQWIKSYNTNKSFKAKDNRSDEENEMIALRKKVKQLEMENDILKQAALIMARK